MATAATKRKLQRSQAIFRLVLLIAIIIAVNVIGRFFYFGIDLTAEKRFTLSTATKDMLRKMDDVAVVTVYLKGKDFPAGLKRLQDAVEERLKTFQDYAGSHVKFRFIDAMEGKTKDDEDAIYSELMDKGIKPSGINTSKDQSFKQQIIIPYALVAYKGKEMPVRLIENDVTGGIDANSVNASEATLEYKLANAINALSKPDRSRVGYIQGHGELIGIQTYDMLSTLDQHYNLDTIDLVNSTLIPSAYDLIIINKPTQRFTERELFKIDQYVMNGGHILWCIDKLQASMDSLMRTQQFEGMDYDLNLDDILFKYGVRINANFIEDRHCTTIPLVNNSSERKEMLFSPWLYFPIFTPTSHHPIVNNLNSVMGMFVNSMDTIANPEVKKTILLQSSPESRTQPAPVRVNLQMARYMPPVEYFTKGLQPCAVLLEGKFRSVFKMFADSTMQKLRTHNIVFKTEADSAGSMIVISDGDIFSNDASRNNILEMGMWQYANPPEKFSNKSFFLNCVEFLATRSPLLEARSKTLNLRLLDDPRVQSEKAMWQALNIGLPIGIVLVFASAYLFFRKRKYESKQV